MKVSKLRVYANAYTCIHRLQGDEDGVTWAGVFPLEPTGPSGIHGQLPRFVGATIESGKKTADESSITVGGKSAVTKFAQHDVVYKYDTEPVEVPNTDYYRQAVFTNDLTGHSPLIAADADTAKACGINSSQFKDPLTLLEELRREAIQRFAASNTDITVDELEGLLPHVFPASKPSPAPAKKSGGQS